MIATTIIAFVSVWTIVSSNSDVCEEHSDVPEVCLNILDTTGQGGPIPIFDFTNYNECLSLIDNNKDNSKCSNSILETLQTLYITIDSIMSNIGAIYVTNTKFEFEPLYFDVLSTGNKFFESMTIADKMLYNMGAFGAPGYQPPKAETVGLFLNDTSLPDLLESFLFWWNTSNWELVLPDEMNNNNIALNFKNTGVKYYENVLNKVANKLLILLGRSYSNGMSNNNDISKLYTNETYFYDLIHRDPVGELKVSYYYPPQQKGTKKLKEEVKKDNGIDETTDELTDELSNEGYFRQSAHSDLGFLTVNRPDLNVPGLQMNINDKWHNVNCTKDAGTQDCFLMNGGNIMVASTNGRWKDAVHRVLINEGKPRTSIIAFFGAKQETYDDWFGKTQTVNEDDIELE